MAKRAKHRSRKTARPRRWLRRWLFRAVVLVLIVAIGQTAWLDLRVRSEFEGRRWAVPARIFARPLELYPGLRIGVEELESELKLAVIAPNPMQRVQVLMPAAARPCWCEPVTSPFGMV